MKFARCVQLCLKDMTVLRSTLLRASIGPSYMHFGCSISEKQHAYIGVQLSRETENS